ncbi:MAG: hypothetical protein O7I93_13170 [Gemmatimonadetes bacterium]|nr:hypothetical protein [Gemmatimonadota bacterium]
MNRLALIGLLAAAIPASVQAQNSIYGTRGLGFPARPLSARSQALGGGSAMFDRASALNPAGATGFDRVTVSAVSATSFREYSAAGVDVTGLRETRFPLGFIGGGIARSAFSFNLGFSTYTERSFDLTTQDTVATPAGPVPVTDRIISDGGVVDVRAAIGWRAGASLGLGAALHLMTGSSRVVARRDFDSDEFRSFEQRDVLSFRGTGFSAGVIWLLSDRVSVAASARVNGKLTSSLKDGSFQDITMPRMLAGGILIGVLGNGRWMTTAKWRSWSRSAADLAASGSNAFDTWEVGSGLEFGTDPTGRGHFPLRVGVRYAQLPFSPTLEQPTEWNFAIGTGAMFAARRAIVDVALERFQRDGAGATERGWYLTIGITITPSQ